jgi:hypothetical protein
MYIVAVTGVTIPINLMTFWRFSIAVWILLTFVKPMKVSEISISGNTKKNVYNAAKGSNR